MCWGNNAKIIHALDRDDQAFITFEEILLCSKSASLKPSLRSKYVKLMIGIATLYYPSLSPLPFLSLSLSFSLSLCISRSLLAPLSNSLLSLSVMYVDVDDNRNVLENLSLSFVSVH